MRICQWSLVRNRIASVAVVKHQEFTTYRIPVGPARQHVKAENSLLTNRLNWFCLWTLIRLKFSSTETPTRSGDPDPERRPRPGAETQAGNMLYLIGLGLGDAADITVKGLQAVKSCSRVYLEAYTSILTVGKEALVSPNTLTLTRLGAPGAPGREDCVFTWRCSVCLFCEVMHVGIGSESLGHMTSLNSVYVNNFNSKGLYWHESFNYIAKASNPSDINNHLT